MKFRAVYLMGYSGKAKSEIIQAPDKATAERAGRDSETTDRTFLRVELMVEEAA